MKTTIVPILAATITLATCCGAFAAPLANPMPGDASGAPTSVVRVAGRDNIVLAGLSGQQGLSAANTGRKLYRDLELATTLSQSFYPPWNGDYSLGNVWRINGPWVGTGNNELLPSLAKIVSSYNGQSGGFLELSVAPNVLQGSEIQTMAGYGYGYYEVRMQVTPVQGVCASFFWIEQPNYGPHEWDIEFLTNESWDTPSSNTGVVHFTVSGGQTIAYPLSFNPSKAFHRYGFLWTPSTIVFTVDGQAAHTFTGSEMNTTVTGFIMANMWTGNPNWGGGPPTQQATTVYDWMKFTAGATSIPVN